MIDTSKMTSDERMDELDASIGSEDTELNFGEIDQKAGAEPRPQADDEPKQTKVQMSPGDMARANIAARFRRDAEGEVPFNGDMADPEMLYGKFGRAGDEPAADLPEPGVPQDKPVEARKIKLKVRGKEIELTEDEVLERARKVEAADSYLDEARAMLEEAKGIKAERAGRDRHPHDGQSSTQDDELDFEPEATSRPHEKTAKDVVEKLQYGDPEEAARDLEDLIDSKADRKADERQLRRLMDNDLARSQKALAEFSRSNPELAEDRRAAKLMEEEIYEIYREDILKLGVVDEDKVPTDRKTLADWHRFYRVGNYDVQPVGTILGQAKDRVLKWRGPASSKPQQAVKQSPRVEVNIDRTERRAAIPTQPSPQAMPRIDGGREASPSSRSATIEKMRKARGQITA